ncbi:MAG: septum formation initiator family protein [Bifidobacteriaceae bacterium]|nr:septum formation initiator family protein [Bifidobacteriaceae bacterium]
MSLPRRRTTAAPPAGGSPVRGRPTRAASPSRRPAGAARIRVQAVKADDAERERVVLGRRRRNVGFGIAAVGLLAMLVFALTFPTMRLYLAERQELETIRAEAEIARRDTEELKAELRRWDDPAFVQAQARERLSYVMPGDIAFKVVDPYNAPTLEPEPDAAALAESVDVRPGGLEGADAIPWYRALWDSVKAAAEPPTP